jgi:hypothetical protein
VARLQKDWEVGASPQAQAGGLLMVRVKQTRAHCNVWEKLETFLQHFRFAIKFKIKCCTK